MFIGVDLGLSRVIVAALGEGVLGEPLVAETELGDPEPLLDQLAEMIDAAGSAEAVGIAIPRIVEFATGRVVAPRRAVDPDAVDFPLANVALREVLEERLGVPVFVDNLGAAAALAEAHDEALEQVVDHLVMLVISATVSGGLLLDGRIYRGATGGAGELGHMIMGLDLAGAVPAPMKFPQPGSLEFATAGHALDRIAQQAGRVHPASVLTRLRAEGRPLLGADVERAAREGDKAAARIVQIWGQRIGLAAANAINIFDPEEVVIGGDAAGGGVQLLEPARHVAHGYVRPGLGARATIRLARHGGRAGVLGAALMARAELGAT